MKIEAIRGLILEEIILFLLEKIGYRIVSPGDEGTRLGKAGLEVPGRGAWHQIDAYAAFDHTPAFVFPLRLLMEAKCYKPENKVKIETIRNSVGVLKDISENYFTYQPIKGQKKLQESRFNFISAVFSTSGFTKEAQRYAIAHQVFLIQYKEVFLLSELANVLQELKLEHFSRLEDKKRKFSHDLRVELRGLLNALEISDYQPFNEFSHTGMIFLRERIIPPLKKIKGSYFGMLQGKWPMHFLSSKPLPAELFEKTDIVKCKIHGRESRRWAFVPSDQTKEGPLWFQLEFDLPDEIYKLVKKANDPRRIADLKKQHFSTIYLSGIIGGVNRQVQLQLDMNWLNAYRKTLKPLVKI